jgi:hypothetical protein
MPLCSRHASRFRTYMPQAGAERLSLEAIPVLAGIDLNHIMQSV